MWMLVMFWLIASLWPLYFWCYVWWITHGLK